MTLTYRILHIPTGIYLRNADMYNSEAIIEFTKEEYAEHYVDQIIAINKDFDNARWVKEEFDIIPIENDTWPVSYVNFDKVSMNYRLHLGVG